MEIKYDFLHFFQRLEPLGKHCEDIGVGFQQKGRGAVKEFVKSQRVQKIGQPLIDRKSMPAARSVDPEKGRRVVGPARIADRFQGFHLAERKAQTEKCSTGVENIKPGVVQFEIKTSGVVRDLEARAGSTGCLRAKRSGKRPGADHPPSAN